MFFLGLFIGLIVGGAAIWLFKSQGKKKTAAMIDDLVLQNKMSKEVAAIIKSILGIS